MSTPRETRYGPSTQDPDTRLDPVICPLRDDWVERTNTVIGTYCRRTLCPPCTPWRIGANCHTHETEIYR